MNILYETIIKSVFDRFGEVKILPSQSLQALAGHRQVNMVISAMTTFAITTEMCQGPTDWVTVIRFFSEISADERAFVRINEYLSDDNLQFAWDKAKTFVITKIDDSERFCVSLTEKAFVFDDPIMLTRNEVMKKLLSAMNELTFGKDS